MKLSKAIDLLQVLVGGCLISFSLSLDLNATLLMSVGIFLIATPCLREEKFKRLYPLYEMKSPEQKQT